MLCQLNGVVYIILTVCNYLPFSRSGGTLAEGDAKFYLAEIVLALNAVHSMGFVHRLEFRIRTARS